jgi:hypothetical protein
MNNLRSRFESLLVKLGEDDCWTIRATPKDTGYKTMWYKGKHVRAHRISLWYFHGEWPPKDKIVCHHCDNRECVNPKHLYLGSYKDNAADAIKRNRHTYKKNLLGRKGITHSRYLAKPKKVRHE